MVRKECSEECCTEHSGVITRLNTGNWVLGVAVTVLIAVFGVQASGDSKNAETLAAIQISVAEIKASLPMTKATVEDLQLRTRELEHRTQGR